MDIEQVARQVTVRGQVTAGGSAVHIIAQRLGRVVLSGAAGAGRMMAGMWSGGGERSKERVQEKNG